ncbi:MAG: UDP-3-O-acyl-N-acetylglucosamine deacetylase [Candidatus Gracilibacteria bacterium]|nr:UDP-3-O-acyl-N-acetylglucosamine deacetylase [Candidatus Gracilibacteria bacterium]
MQLLIGSKAHEAIERDLQDGPSAVRRPPHSLRDSRWKNVIPERRFCTLKEGVALKGRGTFGKAPVQIILKPYHEDRNPIFFDGDHEIPMDIDHLRRGLMRCLALEGEKGRRLEIVEHIISLMGAFRLNVDVIVQAHGRKPLLGRLINWAAGAGNSFPSFPECNGPFIDAIHEVGIRKLKHPDRPVATVKEPVYMGFKRGSISFEPPRDGEEDHMILSNRVNYPQCSVIDDQLAEFVMNSEQYAFLARSRPPNIVSWREKLARLVKGHKAPYFNMNRENCVIISKKGYINKDHAFDDKDGFNWEMQGHEMVDKSAIFYLLERCLGVVLRGRWSTYRISHAEEYVFLRALWKHRDLFEHLTVPQKQPSINPLSPALQIDSRLRQASDSVLPATESSDESALSLHHPPRSGACPPCQKENVPRP